MLRHFILTPAPPGSQDKLEQALKTSRSEAQKKDRVQQRLRVIEEGLKASPQGRALIRRLSAGPSSLPSGVHSTGPNSPRTSFNENGAAALDTASEDGGALSESLDGEQEVVSGMFYDMLQKEVVQLRKAKADQEQVLQDKEDAIEVRSLERVLAFSLALGLQHSLQGSVGRRRMWRGLVADLVVSFWSCLHGSRSGQQFLLRSPKRQLFKMRHTDRKEALSEEKPVLVKLGACLFSCPVCVPQFDANFLSSLCASIRASVGRRG
jgi:hypothetical protein